MTKPVCTIVERDGTVKQADAGKPPSEENEHYEYFVNICRILAQEHGYADANFLIVHDTRGPLPGLDSRSVVIVGGDERCLLPVEAERAQMILKCYGTRPHHAEPLRPQLASLLDHGRALIERARWQLAAARLGRERRRRLLAKLHSIPMGYCRQERLPLLPIDERPYLLSFAGSLDNQKAGRLSYHTLTNYPKRQARIAMVEALRRLEAELPPGTVHLRLTESFAASLAEPGEGYAQTMMRTRICVCPRGTRLETFRIHEGLRFGCVVVSQKLPDFWFLRGAPILQVEDWAELPDVVHGLRADPGRMRSLHEQSLRWWREVCSPAAIAARVADWRVADREALEGAAVAAAVGLWPP
jgi:hypothetical protein